MGMFDDVVVNEGRRSERRGQVKCWENALYTYRLGDKVPTLGNEKNYGVAMREGGFLWIWERTLSQWMSYPPPGVLIFDKYGDPFTISLIAEPYFIGEEIDVVS